MNFHDTTRTDEHSVYVGIKRKDGENTRWAEAKIEAPKTEQEIEEFREIVRPLLMKKLSREVTT